MGDLLRNQARSAALAKEKGYLREKPWVFPLGGALCERFSRRGEKCEKTNHGQSFVATKDGNRGTKPKT
jgi:hypothetical protein